MCCSVSPDVKVHFSNTILYGAEAVNLEGETVHVLGYQNRVQNDIGDIFSGVGLKDVLGNLWRSFSRNILKTVGYSNSGNAMILPFPAIPLTMSQKNIIDTEKIPNVLKDLADTVKQPISKSFYSPRQGKGKDKTIQIFEAAGIYTVILATNALAIPDAINQIPKEKRPKLNPKLFEMYAEWYPDWTIALCCFNNQEIKDALPMIWWYEPMFPEQLFLPALDNHTGNVPKLNEKVFVDHTITAGSCFAEATLQSMLVETSCPHCDKPNSGGLSNCMFCGDFLHKEEVGFRANYKTVNYQDKVNFNSKLNPYLLTQVMGQSYKDFLMNGDFVCQIDDIRRGYWLPGRVVPPGAKQV